MKPIILMLSLVALLGCKSVSDHDMFEMFKSSVNWDIKKEIRGEEPTAGHRNWRDYWIWGAENVRSSKYDEGGHRHVAYIIEQRRKAGLPEIPELLE